MNAIPCISIGIRIFESAFLKATFEGTLNFLRRPKLFDSGDKTLSHMSDLKF